jgi:tRNA N6-adenosine threonylcarbamoyltransferase
MKTYPIILAIDTSCDDTCIAVTQGAKILSNIVASQEELHKKYGGVMPLVAKLAHNDLINPTYQEALKRAKVSDKQIDAIAVTQGPGLAIALEVGIIFAKELAKELDKPLIAVNHMVGHMYSPWAKNSAQKPNLDFDNNLFPAISLLISGGHTEMILLNDIKDFKKIGFTVDDAAGEALDKFARLLDLGYPGAAVMEIIARSGNPQAYTFPLPMTQSGNLNYSFSGLKTFGRQLIEKLIREKVVLNKNDIADLAASFQAAVFRAVIYKLKKAVKIYQPKSLWLGGGVSANLELRKQLRQFCKQNDLQFLYPKLKKLNGDNAAMIGVAAYFNYLKCDFVADFETLQRVPRLSL